MREYQRDDGMIWSFLLTGSKHYYETCYGPSGYFGPFDDSVTDPARYSKRFGLLKRVHTIDSWDFQVMDEYVPRLVYPLYRRRRCGSA
jgi:hypothetical protein